MGTTIEQYTARIGTHDNAARIKDLSRFKSIFWNAKGTFIVLARSLYPLGCIVYTDGLVTDFWWYIRKILCTKCT